MGNYIDIHVDKMRGSMNIDDLGQEAFIHWNGPSLHLADNLGKKSSDRYFKRSFWNFIPKRTSHSQQSRIKSIKQSSFLLRILLQSSHKYISMLC